MILGRRVKSPFAPKSPPYPTALTTFSAASSRSSAEVMARPELFKISLPFSTLVPSQADNEGDGQSNLLHRGDDAFGDDVTTHDAAEDVHQNAFTPGSEVMILNASVTFSFVAPPPTSRKFAGSAP